MLQGKVCRLERCQTSAVGYLAVAKGLLAQRTQLVQRWTVKTVSRMLRMGNALAVKECEEMDVEGRVED